jgi:hypothetical protein
MSGPLYGGRTEAAISQTWYFLLLDRPARQDFAEIGANLVIFSAILKATAFTRFTWRTLRFTVSD